METQYGQMLLSQARGQMPMLEKQGSNRVSFLAPRTSSFNSRPLSEATEIVDTDFEADLSDLENSSNSGNSFGNDSSTTLSSPDGAQTPSPFDSDSVGLAWDYRKSVQGPSGPHLFRTSIESSLTDKIDALEWDFPMSPVNLKDIVRQSPPQEQGGQRRKSVKSKASSRRGSAQNFSSQREAEVRAWTPTQVAEWMYENSVEDAIVGRFIDNDISGSVLLDLQIDDLKELDIQSFGKRHRLISLIQGLLDSLSSTPEMTTTPSSPKPSRISSRRTSHSREHANSTTSPCDNITYPVSPSRRGRRNREHFDVISPAESVSIVAIEQLLPKPHKCSKGENCSKYQRRQRQIAKIAQEFPNEFIQVAGDRVMTTLRETGKADQFYGPKSSDLPSVVASSDVFGPSQHPGFKLNPENLNEVKPRDPQDNVRQFLGFQHMNPKVQADEGHLDLFPPRSPPEPSTPTANRTANRKDLPRLMIPKNPVADSSQHTITPSMGSRQIGSPTATQEYNPYFQSTDMYRHATPFSEMDVPITSIPHEPLARETSQSVPPHLTYGHSYQQPSDPVRRSHSTRPEHRRRPSFATTMTRLEEGKPLSPINYPSDMVGTSGRTGFRRGTMPSLPITTSSSSSSGRDDTSHSGYMKKRRTRLLRHEWQDAHFTLNGTVLAMHKDEQEAHRRSRALETIDVDDYAVACSSLASSSKLTAAFKRTLLKRAAGLSSGSVKGLDETAFAFSLVPASEKADKKLFTSSSKSHHFAVKSRDDRINWMRELMLAKALKKGKDDGEVMQMNGNVI